MIRFATTKDFDAIRRLNLQIFEHESTIEPSSNMDYPFSSDGTEYFMKAIEARDDHAALVYEERGEVRGYAIVKLVPCAEHSGRSGIRLAQLHTLGVDKEYRSQGIGTKLIEASREWAAGKHANRLKIVAYAQNQGARSLYVRAGFAEFEIGYEMKLADGPSTTETRQEA